MSYQLLIGGRPVAKFESAAVSTKVHGMNKANDVTLKRGVLLDRSFASWLHGSGVHHHAVLQQLDGLNRPTNSFHLKNTRVTKFEGPALNASGGGDVAIENLEIAHEGAALDSFWKWDTFRKPDAFEKWDVFEKWTPALGGSAQPSIARFGTFEKWDKL